QDLTGRENIYLNASVLGLGRDQIDASFNDIVAFSELGDYINMPVKHYSSGMYMRLGFSVAIHVQPDILIVDEILAVGDQAFQTKCMDRIYDMKRKGTTIIMVSHNLSMMRKLCTKLIWLENGSVREEGPTEMVAGYYQTFSHDREGKQLSNRAAQSFKRTGSGEIVLTAVRILDAAGHESNTFKTGDLLTIEMDYLAHEPINDPEFGLAFFHQDGTHIAGPNNLVGGVHAGVIEGAGKIRYCVEDLPLLPALYHVTAAIHDGRSNRTFDFHDKAYTFRVVPGGTDEIYGLIKMPAYWQLNT
ncbi:MAG: Wzt carbohydrate-binding domain-containing protein, partial [Anaerolineae bacterium]